jgi:hypothetical protein
MSTEGRLEVVGRWAEVAAGRGDLSAEVFSPGREPAARWVQ